MKPTLIIIAHGSRRKESNKEFKELVLLIENKSKETYHKVIPAFLEISFPSINNAVQSLQKGTKEVHFFPYFLNEGKHIHKDIPEIIAELKNNCPDIDFRQLKYFGSFSEISDLIAQKLHTI